MKRILRILIGTSLVIFPMFLATWIWLFSNEESWVDTVGKHCLHLAIGKWELLPE